MSKFDYMNFEGGADTEFVVHASKYTKRDVLELCVAENDWRFEGKYPLRKPEIKDIKEEFVKYFVQKPESCGLDIEGGCYTYCNRQARGSFPVWVIQLKDLKE